MTTPVQDISTFAPKIVNTYPNRQQGQQITPGQTFSQYFAQRRGGQNLFDSAHRVEVSTDLAQDIADKSGNKVDTNKYGLVTDTKKPDLNTAFTPAIKKYTEVGELAAETEAAKAQYREQQRIKDLINNYNVTNPITAELPAGTTGNNKGALAVARAMSVYKSGTPYVWGGNSLTKGVDCSGLVQQVYKELGVNLPRTTYEQAKSGRVVNMNSLMPGDLIFYNTGSSDPNGIGTYGHVAIYAGNGMIVHARNTKSGLRFESMSAMGTPALAVRPW